MVTKSKLKILHIGKFYYPYHGGMESVVRDMCEGMVEAGHEVQVLCSHDCFKSADDVIKGVKIHRMALLGTLFSQCLNPSVIWKLKKMAQNFDIVHIHSPNPIVELLCLFLPKDIKIVVTHHADIIRQKVLMPFYKPVLKAFLKRVQSIHVPTENHITYSPVLPEFREKCRIVPFGIREDQFQFVANVRREVHRLKQQYSPYVLFVGRLVGYKGIPVLLEAAKQINRRVVIIGSGPYENMIRQYIRDHHLQEKIYLLGRVEQSAKFQAYFYGCDAFILPSVSSNENFGVVQLEAMACSKPLIVSRLKSGVSSVGVEGETTIFFEPGNANELAKSINELADNPEKSRTLGLNGREYFLKHYTLKAMISGLEKVYHDLESDPKHEKGHEVMEQVA